MCLLSFNLRSLASTCSSSVGNNFSFESAHLKALFCNTCNFFLVSFDAECIKTSPYSNIGKIMFLYIMRAAFLVIKDLIFDS